MRLDTHTLSGRALDWAVAYCVCLKASDGKPVLARDLANTAIANDGAHFSGMDSFAGPLIDKAGISTRKDPKSGLWYAMGMDDSGSGETVRWSEFTFRNGIRYGTMAHEIARRRQRFVGNTRLEAAMRCFVASELGGIVDVPPKVGKVAKVSADLVS